jgi:hypothetical protein
MGAVTIDADAVEFRVIPWIIWKYDVDQYAYWRVNYWENLDVFSQPITYSGVSANGDGTFFYPGRDYLFSLQDRGVEGPMSSIRMKNWRRGAQDYEYLWLSKQEGIDIEGLVNGCVPLALWEADIGGDISWSGRGWKFDAYRKQLADLLISATSTAKVSVPESYGTPGNVLRIGVSDDRVTVTFRYNKQGQYHIVMCDAAGRTIKAFNGPHNTRNAHNVAVVVYRDVRKGIYFLRCMMENRLVAGTSVVVL